MTFTEGEWISHIEAGGIGQVTRCVDEDGIEPDAFYVCWVTPPNWAIPSKHPNRRSMWLQGRQDEFMLSPFVPRNPALKADGWSHERVGDAK